MRKVPPIIPVRQIPETFSNTMSPISWLAKLTAKVNEIIDVISGSGALTATWRFSYDAETRTLTLEREDL